MLKKWLKRFKENEEGLTLVELLAVIVILAIVGAIAFVSVGNIIENSKKDAHVANAQQVVSAAKLAEASGDITIGTDEVDVLGLETIGTIIDPWTNVAYTTGVTVSKTGDEYDVTMPTSNDNDVCALVDVKETDLSKGREACQTVSSGGGGD